MTRRLAALALVFGMGAVLGGCGSEDHAGATSTSTADPPSAALPGQAPPSPAATTAQAKRGVRLVRVGTFDNPVYITQPPGDRSRMMVVEQTGRIIVLRGGRKLPRRFLDLRAKVTYGGEQGLLSIAFPPDYQRSGRFYVYYTDRSDADNRIVEYRRSSNPDRADASSARVVLRMPNLEANHNGGLMLFGPDGLMYVGTGDGGGANDQHGTRGNAQNLGSLLGKILRIDPRAKGAQPFSVPADNPFVKRSGARPEIYAYGLRNPWRFSFDRARGDLVIGDVGQDAVEEIDFARKGPAPGANYGWRAWAGPRRNLHQAGPRRE